MSETTLSRLYNEFQYAKLKLVKHVAKSLTRYSSPPEYLTAEEYHQAMEFSIILRDSKDPIQLTAAAIGLDILLPKWRKHFPKDVLGKVVTREDRIVDQWKKACLNRDGHVCVECGSAESISVHHICSWAEFPALRIEVDNGRTLCGKCHHENHPTMGKEMFY